MRVTFFVNNYAPSFGGVQEHVRRVAEGLVREHGMHVEVLTSDALLAPGGPDPGRIAMRDEVIAGVHVHRRPVARRLHTLLRSIRRAGRKLGVYRPGRNTLLITGPLGLRLALEARALARRSDIVVGVGAPSASLWASHALVPGGCPVLAMPLVHLGERPERRWVVRAVRAASAVSANSDAEARWLVAQGVATDRVVVLPPGCDPEAYPEMTPTVARASLGLVERPTVGFIGRLAAHKGVDTLIAAMRQVWVEHPEAQLLLAGAETGWDVEACLAGLSAEERRRVHRWGAFTDEERPLLLAGCDVLAHPSRSESFGMVTIEGWCARRAVVVGDIEVTRDLVRDGIDGDVVPLDAPEELAQRLSRLLTEGDRRERYGAEGRRRAEQDFEWSGIIDRWADLLRDLVPGSDATLAGAA